MTDAEIIKLAAEKVLGLVKVSKPFPLEGEFIIVPASCEEGGLHIHPSRMFDPLHSISDAWMLVEKLDMHFSIQKNFDDHNRWNVIFDKWRAPDEFEATEAEAPRTITLAALRAVGEKV